MDFSKTKINYTALKGRIKQKYGFLIGNYNMFEEGRNEVIEESDLNKKNKVIDGFIVDTQDRQDIKNFKY